MTGPHGLELNMLVALDALLTERSVTRAAGRLGVTQSAVSHRLKALREALSDPLLVGAGRGEMVLTARAKAMREPLGRALSDLRSAVAPQTPFDPKTATRHFVISTSDLGEFLFLPRALEYVGNAAPNVTYALVPPSRALAEDLASSRIDLAVGATSPKAAGLLQKKLGTQHFVVVAREGHPQMRKKRITLERYLELDHLLVTPSREPGGVVDDQLAARGLKRRVAVRVSHFVVAPFVVARSDLLLTAPEPLVREACHHLALSVFPPPLPLPSSDIVMYWHERSQVDPAHQWLRHVICAVIPQIVAGR